MIHGNAVLAPAGTRGFDCDQPLTLEQAKVFFNAGYRFVCRYVPRVTWHTNDLSAKEIEALFGAGLAVMAVQHVEAESDAGWIPDADKGTRYGNVAAATCIRIGIAPGTMVWLDLEDVQLSTKHSIVIDYCNNWFDAVASVGFTPGVYVGWHPDLNPQELYARLRFEHYWGSYNLNRDQEPVTRGIQMKQGSGKAPGGLKIDIDIDLVKEDNLGGLPIVYAPDEWAI